MKLADNLYDHVVIDTDNCWLWTRSKSGNGYGSCRYNGKQTGAHIVSYIITHGVTPEVGQTVDHQCHNQDPLCPGGWTCKHRRCINPAHLRLITKAENSAITTWSRRDTCIHGHPWTPENTYYVNPERQTGRHCRACQRIANRKTRKQQLS